MNTVRTLHMPTDKGKEIKKKLYVPKSTLKLLEMSEEEFFENWDEAARRFGFSGRGDLLAHLFSPDGDVEIIARPRKRRS